MRQSSWRKDAISMLNLLSECLFHFGFESVCSKLLQSVIQICLTNLADVASHLFISRHPKMSVTAALKLNSTTLSGHAFLWLNQKALRRSHVIHGLHKGVGHTIQSHVQILTPCLEVCVCVCCTFQKCFGLCGHFPIRCRLASANGLNNCCNTRLFPFPQLRDLSNRPCPQTSCTVTHTSYHS